MTEDATPEGGEEQEEHPSDLSVPWWVWVILGFTLLMAVVIVMIIWGGGGAPTPRPSPAAGTNQRVVEPSTAPTTAPEFQPATTAPATTAPAA